MTTLRHKGPRHLHLESIRGLDKYILEFFSRQIENDPYCQCTGDPGSIASGSPGAFSYVTWTPNSNPVYDTHNMVTGAPTATIRIPQDGLYDIWLKWAIADNVASATSLSSILQFANTSDTGIASPSWSTLPGGQSKTLATGTSTVDTSFMCLYRGNEFHANDLARVGVQIYGSQTLTATTVAIAEFRYIRPLPEKSW